uniref:Uncharacterized protein n=1 Tax=Spironucleus salmonicida TaxID=348837 RepID=V6LMB7_9EUKA|eukprot:EST44851.1 Hypothetical protein SS50377_15246 [Spironucleus salmonicida]
MNLFQLPIHFLGTGICLFMFQQLCHVSYLFKAEYFALFSLVKNDLNDTLTNAVISQSSKSGKSVALYTQYFFHLLMGNVPILFNMDTVKIQPLYKYRTHSFHQQLDDQYKNTFELQNLTNLKETVLADVCNFHTFQLESLDEISYIYYKMRIFIDKIASSISLITELKYNNSIYQQFSKLKLTQFFILDDKTNKIEIEQELVLAEMKMDLDLKHPIILVDECLQSQKDKFSKCVKLCQFLFTHYEEKLIKLGKEQYKKIQDRLSIQEFQEIDKLGDVKNKKYHLAINVISQLLIKELLESAKTELDKINMSDLVQNKDIYLYQTLENIITSVQSQNADQIFNTIHANQGIIVEYFKSLNNILGKSEYILIAMEYLRLEIAADDLLDELVVHSPQILNIRNKTDFRKIFFSGMVSYRNRGQYYQDFETNFYKLILSLFNPRGVETAFWKAFSVIAFKYIQPSQPNGNLPNDKKEEKTTGRVAPSKSWQGMLTQFWSSSVQSLISEYFMLKENQALHEELQDMIKTLPQMTVIYTPKYKIPNFDFITVIMVGTDLTVINFLTVNQFCYNILTSRVGEKYINTQILGYVQPHASLLSSLQYEQRRMVVDDKSYNDSVVAIADTVKTFAEETPILVSLLYSMMTEKSVEMQFMCSSVCPSIWFQYNQKILNFNATSRHVVSFCLDGKDERTEHTMYQFDSLTQTCNNIIIHKGTKKDSKFQLTKGDAHFELLQDNQNYNISCIASSTLNYEVVSVLNYQLMLTFIEQYSTSEIDEAAAQATLQQLSKFFKRSVLLEFMHVILFMAKLTWQSATLINNISLIMSQVDNGNIYVQYLHGGSITAAKSEDVFNLLERTPVPHNFMFLNPTFDYAFQNFNKDPTISIYEQVLDDSVAAAKETFQLLRQRLPVQPESTTKKEEPSAKEAIVEQDGGAQADVGSTTYTESTTKKENPPPQKSRWSRIWDRIKMLLMQVYPIKTISQENQCKAQEELKEKQTGHMLIIVIPFDKKMCFTDSLDKARHKIFDFIVTFHGYPDLGLETIDGCQVLPIECGHHIPEVLAEKVKAFTLNNVLQVGLDKKGAHLILDVNYKSQNWQYNLQKAEDLVKVQQQTEKDKNVKHAEILQSEIQKIVKHSFYKISCRQDCYTESFIEFLKINIPFNVFQDYGSNFIQIKQELDQTAKDKLDTMEQFQKCINFDIQFQPQGTTQFELGSTTMKAQTNDKQIRLSVLFIQDKQRIIYQLSQLYHMLGFNICNDEIISVFFTASVDIYKFLEKLQLRLVFAQGENDYQYLYVENNPDTIQQKEEVLSAQILMDANLAAVQALNNQQNFSADVRNLVMYTDISLSFKADVNIKCQYQAKNFQFTITYNDLLEQLQTFGSIIYQYENGTLFLKNSNIHLISIFRLNSPSFQSFREDEWKYFSLLTQFCNQQENTRQQIFQQKFCIYFDQISKLLQKVTVDKVVYFGFQYECEQITYGQREHFRQRQFLSPNKLDSKQLLKLFVESKVIILSTKIKDNKKNKVLVKIYFFE